MDRGLRALSTVSALAFVVVLSAIAPASGATVLQDLRTVALSDRALPGVPSTVIVEQFGYPLVDATGRTSFKALLLPNIGGVAANTHSVFWSEAAIDDLRFVARQGTGIPGFNYKFGDLSPGDGGRISRDGNLYFLSGMTKTIAPATSSSGLFRYSPSNGLELLVASAPLGEGSVPTIGNAGTFLSNFYDFNNSGDVAVQAAGGFGAIYENESPLPLRVVASTGSFPAINDERDVVHRVIGNNFVNRIDVWNRTARRARTIAIDGAAAPGAGGATFRNLGLEGTFSNVNGPVIFLGRLNLGGSVTEANDFGLWRETSRGGPVSLLLREGDPAPGAPGLVVSNFNEFTLPMTFGRSGGIVLRGAVAGAGVTDKNDDAVWAGTPASGFHLVARAGDPAPGTEPGTVFSFFDLAGVTQGGRAVFHAFLEGPNLSSDRDRGLFAEAPDGTLEKIARRGDVVALPGGATALLNSIQWTPGEGVGEHGHISFISDLSTGQRGVFTSSLVAVPEARSLSLAFVGVVFLARRRRELA